MIELALLAGLGTLGYVLATQQKEHFELPPRKTVKGISGQDYIPDPVDEDDPTKNPSKGHSNEVPYFGARLTQSMYSGATNGTLDNHTGAGKEYFQKREVKSFFDAKPATGNPYGAAAETDFMQSRMVTGQRMNNVFPVEQVQVGPGVNDGYTNIPKGGFQQDKMREFELPKTTDELRVVGQEKLSYSPPVIPGANIVTQPGVQADVKKNRPDRYVLYGMDRANTAVGAQTAPRIYSDQPMKEQARESTSVYHNNPAGGAVTTFVSYIRAFTEPYQEFMRLTAEGRAGPAGLSGMGTSVGADQYSAQTKFDMDPILAGATRFNVPQVALSTQADQLGSYRFNKPLQEDAIVQRNDPSMLSAFNSNPYTHKLTSY
jgi:hypothetical protein